ncbi:hypothetical protein EOPP23_16110 [Endozoicomonas sp. OPT23]|uniref:YchJ family protein n=1 Tax=Endozoicomonas sp. OPT23 TaxID=2072845 RepID=UPI00129BF01B|nr:YchJ family protein [Endozoicomonas sp. OPT23]MRI34511.1 hypothetical protein [Endozoicomonas sp. OPT23]
MTIDTLSFEKTSSCPCGSGNTYIDCCDRYHNQGLLPETAEQLMRSRFCAYYLKNNDYLIETTWPRQHEAMRQERLHQQEDNTRWSKLDILSTVAGKEGDTKGKVEFKAWFINPASGNEEPYHENSDFIRESGSWYFIYPNLAAKPPARNDPCLCGSGKKFKKCCI